MEEPSFDSADGSMISKGKKDSPKPSCSADFQMVETLPSVDFLEALLRLELVKDSVSVAKGSYRKVKSKHSFLRLTLNAAEGFTHVALSTSYTLGKPLMLVSQRILDLEKLNRKAAERVDQLAGKLPLLQKPLKEVASDVHQRSLLAISGVSPTTTTLELPKNVFQAVKIRIYRPFSLTALRITASPPGRLVQRVIFLLLDKVHHFEDIMITPIPGHPLENEYKNENLSSWQILKNVFNKPAFRIPEKLIIILKRVKVAQGQESWNMEENYQFSLEDLIAITNYWMEGIEKDLERLSEGENQLAQQVSSDFLTILYLSVYYFVVKVKGIWGCLGDATRSLLCIGTKSKDISMEKREILDEASVVPAFFLKCNFRMLHLWVSFFSRAMNYYTGNNLCLQLELREPRVSAGDAEER